VTVEPLRNKYFEAVLNDIDYPDMDWGWLRLISYNQMTQDRLSGLDFLGVEYFLSTPGTPIPSPAKLIYSGDLDVWKRGTSWPRAFYTNKVIIYDGDINIAKLLDSKRSIPFAAISKNDINIENILSQSMMGEVLEPAYNYELTTNNTSFTVKASAPGYIVLHEAFYPGDFEVYLNNKRFDYIRVNKAFMGVYIDEPGVYEVKFIYRPKLLSISLVLAVLGLILGFSLPILLKKMNFKKMVKTK
jgi:hypothetical protein